MDIYQPPIGANEEECLHPALWGQRIRMIQRGPRPGWVQIEFPNLGYKKGYVPEHHTGWIDGPVYWAGTERDRYLSRMR